MAVLAALAAASVLVAALAWFAWDLLRRNGRLRLRVAYLEEEIQQRRPIGDEPVRVRPFRDRSLAQSRDAREGLAPGTPAPPFALPTVDGEIITLNEYAGRRVLLVFSEPGRGACGELAPRLERLSRQASGIQVLMVSRGDRDSNRRNIAEHRLTFPVVLQAHWEISNAYGTFATPMAYAIDERGRIATGVAAGLDQIVALVAAMTAFPPRAAADARGYAVQPHGTRRGAPKATPAR
ncbi:MAG: peroxiredoxin family protein [Vicinamibacterales bacterium]